VEGVLGTSTLEIVGGDTLKYPRKGRPDGEEKTTTKASSRYRKEVGFRQPEGVGLPGKLMTAGRGSKKDSYPCFVKGRSHDRAKEEAASDFRAEGGGRKFAQSEREKAGILGV